MANDAVNRFFGGSPLSALVRIILLSILVGVILSALGLDPRDIWRSIERLARSIWDMASTPWCGCGAISCSAPSSWLPIWLLLRLARSGRS